MWFNMISSDPDDFFIIGVRRSHVTFSRSKATVDVSRTRNFPITRQTPYLLAHQALAFYEWIIQKFCMMDEIFVNNVRFSAQTWHRTERSNCSTWKYVLFSEASKATQCSPNYLQDFVYANSYRVSEKYCVSNSQSITNEIAWTCF